MSRARFLLCMILPFICTLACSGCGEDRTGAPLPAPAEISWRHMSSSEKYPHITGFAFGPHGAVFAANAGEGVCRSLDGGKSWDMVRDGLANVSIQCIAVSPNGDIFVVLYGEGVYRSTNSGDTWQAVNNGLDPATWYGALAIDGEGTIYLVLSSGTFRS